MYQVKILSAACKDLDRFPKITFLKLTQEIDKLKSNPRPFGVMKLTNEEGYRVRVGDYRILYRVDDPVKQIFVYRIKHRKEAYR